MDRRSGGQESLVFSAACNKTSEIAAHGPPTLIRDVRRVLTLPQDTR
jgi:hypothetical protein